MVTIRKIGKNANSVKQVSFGVTQSAATGSEGPMSWIKNNIKSEVSNYKENIALRLEARNARLNVALDIISGGIRMNGRMGYTGTVRGLVVVNGIIVGKENAYSGNKNGFNISDGVIRNCYWNSEPW